MAQRSRSSTGYNKNSGAVNALSPSPTDPVSAALRFIHLDELEAQGYGEYKTLFDTEEEAR